MRGTRACLPEGDRGEVEARSVQGLKKVVWARDDESRGCFLLMQALR